MSSFHRIILDIKATRLYLWAMNRPRDDSIANAVRSRVIRGGTDRLWTYADFPGVDRSPLAATLSRLAKSGELTRVRRGVYYRPGKTIFGSLNPDPGKLTDAVLRARGEPAIASGIGAYNRFGLTTQVSGVVSRATLNRIPENSVPGVRLFAAIRPLDKQKGIRSEERIALDALRDITRIPDAHPAAVVRRIGTLIRTGDLDFLRLARYARAEPPRVRALLGALGDMLRRAGEARRIPLNLLNELRKGLNPLTTFHIRGAREAFGDLAAHWRIR
jgi:hypothetical protein